MYCDGRRHAFFDSHISATNKNQYATGRLIRLISEPLLFNYFTVILIFFYYGGLTSIIQDLNNFKKYHYKGMVLP